MIIKQHDEADVESSDSCLEREVDQSKNNINDHIVNLHILKDLNSEKHMQDPLIMSKTQLNEENFIFLNPVNDRNATSIRQYKAPDNKAKSTLSRNDSSQNEASYSN